MRVREDPRIAGLVVFEPEVLRDERGFLCVTAELAETPGQVISPFRQIASRSERGVIRGMHVRSGAGEAKLVRCPAGSAFDVIADLRPSSPTYRDVASSVLDDKRQVSLYIPAGCAHGWQALTEPADLAYTSPARTTRREDLEIDWADPDLGISWPLPAAPGVPARCPVPGGGGEADRLVLRDQ